MRNIYKTVSFACLVSGLAVLAGPAQSGAAVPAPANSSAPIGHSAFPEVERRAAAQEGLSEQDKTFLMTAAQSQMLQLEVSRVAIKRAKSPGIRRFAEATVKFIGGANRRLENIASEFGMSLPKIPPDDVQNAHQALDQASDPDHDYLAGIISDTAKIDDLYKEEASSAKNPVLARYAQEALPRLRQHYRNAHNLLAQRPTREKSLAHG